MNAFLNVILFPFTWALKAIHKLRQPDVSGKPLEKPYAGGEVSLCSLLYLSTAAVIMTALVLAVSYQVQAGVQGDAQSPPQNPQATAPAFVYEIVSVKPTKPGSPQGYTMFTADGFKAANTSLLILVDYAFGITDKAYLDGAPPWISTERFELDAKMDPSVADAFQKLSKDDRTLVRQHMLQAVLADRFKLTFHRETREVPVYTLVIGKNGSKLKETKPDVIGSKGPDGRPIVIGVTMGMVPGGISWTSQAISLDYFCRILSREVGRTVLDKTGLTGNYEFSMQFTPETMAMRSDSGDTAAGAPPVAVSDPGPGSIFTAVQDQLGLKLLAGKAPIEVVVIDHIERPSGN
jgi:bla regulator protein blaR1